MEKDTGMTHITDVLGADGAGEAMQPVGVAQIRTAMETLEQYKAKKDALSSA